jgi:3-phytase
MRKLLAYLVILTFLTSINSTQAQSLEIPALAETAPTPDDGATSAAIWLHPTDLSQSLILGTDDNQGVGVYDLEGNELQFWDNAPIGTIDLRYNFVLDDERIPLVAGSVKDEPQVALWTIDPETRELEEIARIDVGIAANGACLYLSGQTGEMYVFVNSEEGDVEQYLVRSEGGEVVTRLARSFSVGSETEGCVADDELGVFYIGEEEVALWRYGAEPESGNSRRIVDIVGGNISEQVEGLSLVAGADGAGYLIAANEQSDTFNVYERGGANAFIGSFGIDSGDLGDRVTEPNGLAVASIAIGTLFPDGLIVSADETNSNPNGRNNFKLASWGAAAEALGIASLVGEVDPRVPVERAAARGVPTVTAALETTPVDAGIDAADDPAIWVDPSDPAQSLVIGTDKTPQGGLVVYALDGSIRQFVSIGRVNNVDLRQGFMLDGVETTLVVATNRTDRAMVIYALDHETRELREVGDPVVSDMREVYGICMYRSPRDGAFYAFVNSANTGETEQYLLTELNGRVEASLVREFVVGSQTEGCAADDETGILYMGEEAVGVWRYGAEPTDNDERVLVDGTGENGNLVADVEGVALYYAADSGGYIVVSSQGSSEFMLYERAGDNAYVGRFTIVETDAVDAVSGSDGLDVTNLALNAMFPDGLLVVQDDLNLNPDGNQNFKLVSWSDIASALSLSIDNTYLPGE